MWEGATLGTAPKREGGRCPTAVTKAEKEGVGFNQYVYLPWGPEEFLFFLIELVVCSSVFTFLKLVGLK